MNAVAISLSNGRQYALGVICLEFIKRDESEARLAGDKSKTLRGKHTFHFEQVLNVPGGIPLVEFVFLSFDRIRHYQQRAFFHAFSLIHTELQFKRL